MRGRPIVTILAAVPVRAVAAMLVLATLAFACTPVSDAGVGLRIKGSTMGTSYLVRIDDATEDSTAAIRARVEETLERVDRLMSTYRHDSEISRLNRTPSGEPASLSEETRHVLEAAQALARDSGGAFDVTAGALVNAWGFGPPGSDLSPPEPATLTRIREQVGHELLRIDASTSTAIRAHEGVYVDLSAIAKGYAVDAVIAALQELGYRRLLVEIGGEVRVGGTTADGRVWRLGIERPEPSSATLQRRVALRDVALATSGNYRNFYRHEGRVVGHTIDPRTGYPVDHDTAAVSVIATDCMRADALATTLMVMGVEEGLVWAREREIAALFLVREGGEIVERPTPAFGPYLTPDSPPEAGA